MNKFNLYKIKAQLPQARRKILVQMGNTAQNYFVRSFSTQSFGGVKWEEVQRKIAGTSAYKYPKNKKLARRTKPILIGKGTLRRAVSNMSRTAQIMSGEKLRMVVDLPYAMAHNEGTNVIPQRQFVGQTAELTMLQQRKVTQIIDRLWQA